MGGQKMFKPVLKVNIISNVSNVALRPTEHRESGCCGIEHCSIENKRVSV